MDNYTAKPELPYRYEFGSDELGAMQACVDAHGFAVVKDVLSPEMINELCEAVLQVVDPNGELGPGQSRTHISFIEQTSAAWKLLDYEPFMALQHHFNQSDDLTIHRSAAIIRNPGSTPLTWHSDWLGFSTEAPRDANEVLNRGPGPSGMWFYLTGSYPEHGGLAVIADSHTLDWPGPQGFKLTEDRRSFYPESQAPAHYAGFDVPGLVPLCTEPADLIIFGARTYHAAFPNQIDRQRLSCGVIFRPRHEKINRPWPLPASAQEFVSALPTHLKPLAEGYTGIDPTWSGAA